MKKLASQPSMEERQYKRGELWRGRVAYVLQTAVKNGKQSALPPYAHNLMKRARVATTSSAMVECMK